MNRIPRIGERAATWPVEAVGWFAGLVQFHAQRVAAQDRGKGLPAARLEQPTQLPAAEDPFRRLGTKSGRGQFPSVTENKTLGDVEIRKPAGHPLIEEELVEESVGEGIVGFGGRERIYALAPGVSAVELEAVAHTLGDVGLQRVVEGVGLPQGSVNAAEIGV